MITYALYVFAAVFFVVGLFRIVEFKAAGVSRFQQMILIPLHVLGCGLFSTAFILMANDPVQVHKKELSWLFFSGLFILCPMHIYVGIKRKIRFSQ
jgi:hypothetical protein